MSTRPRSLVSLTAIKSISNMREFGAGHCVLRAAYDEALDLADVGKRPAPNRGAGGATGGNPPE